MAGQGFSQSVAGVIQYLRNTLADYSGSFVILKELIQNADDAGATKMEVGWSCGLPNANHPLLRGPCVFAANNGRFTWTNAWAIRNIGLSDKPGETSAIGKFGLGLKSIFRLCEAFFYVGRDGTTPSSEGGVSWQQGFVNPWSPARDSGEEEFHAEWDNLSAADFPAIVDELKRFDPAGPWASGKSWFCLWVPLRRQVDCGNVPPIHSFFPGHASDPVERVIHPLPLLDLAEVLPMLRHLEVVRIWAPDPTSGYVMEAAVELDEASQRRRWTLEEGIVGEEWPLSGHVQIRSSAPPSPDGNCASTWRRCGGFGRVLTGQSGLPFGPVPTTLRSLTRLVRTPQSASHDARQAIGQAVCTYGGLSSSR